MKRILPFLLASILTASIAQAQNVGIGTATPGTKLDVNGALTLREGSTLISTGTSTGVIPNGYSQVLVTGSPSGAFTLTGPATPANAGQRLVIYNNTTGGYAATFGGATINNGTAMEFVYSNSVWVPTSPMSTGSTAYIQNQTSADQTAGFRITGNGLFNGGSVGIGTTSPNASAALDISSITKGFLPPRMTTAQEAAIVSPTNGLVVFNTTTKCLDMYSAASSTWESVYCSCPTLPALSSIVGASQVCYSSNNTYYVPSVQGASSYTWSVTGNPTITGNGTNTISFTPISSLTSYVVSVTASNACGSSSVSTSSSVNEFTGVPGAPAWSSAPASTVCTNASSVGYTITSGIGLNGTTAQTYNWTFTATGAGTTATVVSTGQVVSVGSPVTITGTTNLSYALNYGSTSGGSITVSVTGTNLCGTGSALTQVVNVAAQPSLTASTPAAQIVCSSSTVAPNAISTTPSGGTGTITYQWYSSSSLSANSGGTSLGSSNGAQTTSYTPPASTTVTTNYYYMVMSATGAGCTAATTPLNNASVQIVAQPSINAPTPATQTVCTNGAIATISATTGGGTGVSPVYQWYSAASAVNTGGTSLGSANGAQTLSYTPPATASTGNTYYYLTFSTTGNGCNVATSAAASDPLVTVVAQPSLSAFTNGTQTVCSNGTISAISVTPSNGTGTPSYQWYSTATNDNTSGTTIGTNATSFTPSPTTTQGTTYYYVTMTMTGSGCNAVTAPTAATGADASVTVVALPALTAPTASPSAAQIVCASSTTGPNSISTTASGGTGTIGYQWYTNTSNSNSGGTLISGATSLTYTPPATTTQATTYYFAKITATGSGCTTAASALPDASVQVVAQPGVTSFSPTPQTVCTNGTIATITATTSGGTGTGQTYQWYSAGSAVNTGGSLISGATSVSYAPPATTTTGPTYYYMTFNTTGNACATATNTAATDALVTVVAQPALTSPTPASQIVCTNGTPSQLSVTPSGGTGTSTYQWVSTNSNANSGGSNVGTNAATYTPASTSSTGTTYFYATLTMTGSGCNVATSPLNDASVQVVAQPTVGNPTPSTQSNCSNGTATAITVSPSGGQGTFGYQWYSAATNVNSGGTSLGSANGAQTASLTPVISAAGTLYYYCTISQTGAGCGPLTTASGFDAQSISSIPSSGTPTLNLSASSICDGSSITLTLSGGTQGTGAVAKFYTGSCDGTLVATGNGATVSPPAASATTYYGRWEDPAPCSGTSSCSAGATVTSYTANTAMAWNSNTTGPTLGGTYTYSFTGGANATAYTWTVPSGWTINSGQGTSSISVTLPANNNGNTGVGNGGNKTLSVSASNPGCGATSLSETVVVHGTVTYSYTGSSQTFTTPAGITTASVYMWGGGGAGAGGNSTSNIDNNGGGGGGGACAYGTPSVSGAITVTIGAGGTGGTGTATYTAPGGGATSFGSYSVNGGSGGKYTTSSSTAGSNTNAGGAGGTGGTAAGFTFVNGGAGGAGSNGTANGVSTWGGSGGGSAGGGNGTSGVGGAGNSGCPTVAGAAGTGSPTTFNGGAGGTTSSCNTASANVAGNSQAAPGMGGGGSGSCQYSNGALTGGNGGNGQVIVVW